MPPGAFTAGDPAPTVSCAFAATEKQRQEQNQKRTAEARRARSVFVFGTKHSPRTPRLRGAQLLLPFPIDRLLLADDRAWWNANPQKLERRANDLFVAAVEGHLHAVVRVVETGIAADPHRGESGDRRIEVFGQRPLAQREVERARGDRRDPE